MTPRRGQWRPLHDALWFLVVLAIVSMLTTLHLGDSLAWFTSRSPVKLTENPRGRSKQEALGYFAAKIGKSNVKDVDKTPDIQRSIDTKDRQPFHLLAAGKKDVKDSIHEPHRAHYSVFDIFYGKLQNNLQNGDFMDRRNVSCLQNLYDKISQVENASFTAPGVIVKGSLSSIKHHLPLIESAFHKVKVKVAYEEVDDNSMMTVSDSATKRDNWSIILCLNTSKMADECVITALGKSSKKVNTIPLLTEVIASPRLMCESKDQKLHGKVTGQWYGGKLPCFLSTSEQMVEEDDCDGRDGWWKVRGGSSGILGQYIPCGTGSLQSKNPTSRFSESILIPLPKNLLTLGGSSPLVWQVQVLVTSLLPPRVYLHHAGVAWEGLQEFVHRKHQKNVSLLDLHQLITELDSESTAALTLQRLENVVMKVVKIVGKQIIAAGNAHKLCKKCFQLLDTVLVFDANFYPILLQATSSQYSEHLSSLSDYLLEQNILEDLAAMLVSRETVSVDILKALANFGLTHIMNEKVCNEKGDFCLEDQDISYLLDTRREQKASRNWNRIFPSSVMPCNNAQPFSVKSSEDTLNDQPLGVLEKFALSMEAYFLCPVMVFDKTELWKSGLNIPVNTKYCEASNSLPNKSPDLAGFLNQGCSNDNSTLPFLSDIYSFPYIQLHPEFSPLHTEYQAYVDYHTTLIQIQGVPRHCRNQARLEDKHDESRWGNFSLGLGENIAHLLVVGTDHAEPYVHNIYKITIHRRKAIQDLGRFDPHRGHHQVCSLKQDCSLPVLPDEPCGLQPLASVSSWRDFLRHHFALPPCGASSMAGEWMVPCTDCHNESSCHWSDAIWQPVGCREGKLGREELKHCLTGKKVLFIGDSTNRGILHYILERLNGTLVQWDKTHNIRIYPDLNDNQTVFGFAYYPQFWLMSQQRPMFDKVFSHLINRTKEWSDKETVIVLGGVHWLAKHHLDMLAEGLWREGLINSRVIVKGLGAGFHQPVSGLHQLSLEDQQRLPIQNQAVLSYALKLGFSVVDTFFMTMSRYKNFLQGKCACHFHKVSEVQSLLARKLSWSSSAPSDHILKYHVDGDINAAYSEMVINRICA